MNLRNLRYFCAACETGSTVAAARQCHVTQPVISNAIAQLEEELGTVLFTRQPRGLAPTPAGLRLHRQGAKLLADASAIVDSFRDPASRPRLTLRLHAALDIAHVTRLLRHVRRELMPLELTVLDHEGEAADLALVPEPCVAAGHTFTPLWEETYVLVVPADHPLALRDEVSLRDLHGTAFVDRLHCELAQHWHAGLAEHRVVPEVRARVTNESWAMGLVAAGVGVTIAPLHAVTLRTDVVVRRDVPELQSVTRRIGFAHAGPAAGTVADVLRVCEGGAIVAAALVSAGG